MNKTKKINLRSFRELLLVGVVIVLCMIWTIMNLTVFVRQQYI